MAQLKFIPTVVFYCPVFSLVKEMFIPAFVVLV